MRKTNYNRASMKRAVSDNRMSTTNIDFEDRNSNSVNNNFYMDNGHRSEGNVVYQSKVKEPRSKMMMDEPQAGPSKVRSTKPFDMNKNNYVQEEIAPGLFVEGYVADL